MKAKVWVKDGVFAEIHQMTFGKFRIILTDGKVNVWGNW
jgi:hypothetical protein